MLHEAGMRFSGAALQAASREWAERDGGGLSVDVAQAGVRGLVAALLAAEHHGADLHVLREPAALPEGAGQGGRIWLQTSGTTGRPKWVGYEPARLAARIAAGSGARARWLLSFSAGSFAGMQVVLSAMKGGHDLIAPPAGAGVAELADLAADQGATHISGTPTFWRAFLIALDDRELRPRSITLGGEAADQAILDALGARFPQATLRHIYASTEAGAIFSVSDGRAGFPRAWLETGVNGIALAVSDQGTLVVRNPEASDRAQGTAWDTSDVVELVGDRVLFRGRIDSQVNIGGVKVYPEEVEAFILRLPFVQEARVAARPNPITGSILTAEIVLKPWDGDAEAALRAHMGALPRTSRPAAFRFVETLALGATGKKLRHD